MTVKPSNLEIFFERVTAWVGSLVSLFVHTLFFLGAFAIAFVGWAPWDMVLLVLTTVVSLEAIYLAIFIQMTVNRNTRSLREVEADVEDIQEDIEEISEDVGEISEDVEEISEDVEDIQEDVEEIQEGVQEMSDDWDLESGKPIEKKEPVSLDQLTEDVQKILAALQELKKK